VADDHQPRYDVVINPEEQYSIWPAGSPAPPGWRMVGVTASKADCLAYIENVWTDMRPASLRSGGVHDLVAEQVRRQPDAPAVRDALTGEALTYTGLWRSAGLLATDLAARGVGGGHVVAVRLDRSVDMIVAILGIMRSGAAYVCLDPDSPPNRTAALLTETQAAAVIEASDARRTSTEHGLRLVLRQTSADARTAGPVRGDDPMYVMFTSGSTGSPKGVVVPHRAVRRLAVAPNFCTIEPGDRVANAANPAFDATTFEVWNTLVAGATVVVFPSLTDVTFSRWSELIAHEGITTMFLTTSLFHLIARERPDSFQGLRTLVVGGEQLDLAATRRVLASSPPDRLVNGYGPTETTTFATYFDCTVESLAGVDRIPVGFPLQNTTLHILDDQLNPVAPGEAGELCVGGPAVALGYLGRPDLTAQRFVTESATGQVIYRTGDLARQRPDGAIELLGRLDRQFKLWGFRIEPEEVESAIVATGLAEAAFVEKIGNGPTARLVGFVLPAHSTPTEELRRTLSSKLTQQLPSYMIPNRWVILSNVPLNQTGKTDRTQLLALLAENSAD
jgi:amino acid adenylation domain-containing protein